MFLCEGNEGNCNHTWMSRWKLGSMVSKGYIGVITRLLTFYELPGTSKYTIEKTFKNINKKKLISRKKGTFEGGFFRVKKMRGKSTYMLPPNKNNGLDATVSISRIDIH